MEAAELKPVVKCAADRRVARKLLEDEGKVVAVPNAGEIVLVRVALGDVVQIAGEIFKAGRRLDERLAVAPDGHGERVGNAVLVHVAQVVLDLPFLCEDRLGDRVEVGAVLGLRGRQRNAALSGRPCDLGRNRVAEDGIRRRAVLVERGEDPEVEEAVLAVGGIVDIPVSQAAVAVLVAVDVDADVHAAVEGVVVRRRTGLIAEGVCRRVRLLTAVPRELEGLGRRERRAGDEGVALAEAAARVHAVVPLRKRGGRRAARGTRRKRLEELGGLDRIEVGEGHRAAVLVLYRHRDDLVALRAAEVRHERARLSLGDELGFGVGVLAAGERDLDAGAGAVGPGLGPVTVDIVLYLPLDRILRSRATSDLPRVRVLLRRVGANLGLEVVDDERSRLGSEVVRVCGHMARRQHVVVHDERLDPEAVDGGVVRAVHGGDGEGLRERRLGEGDEIVVAIRVIRMLRIGKRVEPGLCVRRGKAEAGVKLEKARVLAGRCHARDLDENREVAIVPRIPVPDADGELALVGVIVVKPLDKGNFLFGGLLDDGLVEHRHVDRVGDRAPALHVLVLHLGLDEPLAGRGERVVEQVGLGIAVQDHRIVVDGAVGKHRRPAHLERVDEVRQVVVAGIVDDGLEPLRLAHRQLVGEVPVVAARILLGGQVVHFEVDERRLDVVHLYGRLRGGVALDSLVGLVGSVPELVIRQHDLERDGEARRRKAVEEHDHALDLVGVLDRNTLGVGHAEDEVVGRRGEHVGCRARARLQVGVHRPVGVFVLLGELDLDAHGLTFVEGALFFSVALVPVGKRRRPGFLDVGEELAVFALPPAHVLALVDRRNDIDLAHEVKARHRVLENRLLGRLHGVRGVGKVELVQRAAIADVVAAVELDERVGAPVLDVDLVAGRRVVRVGIGVADGDRERDFVVAGRGDGLRALFRCDNRGYLGLYVERLRAAVRLGDDGLGVGVVDRGLELDLVAAERVRVGAEREDVDRLPVDRVRGDAHDRKLCIAAVGHRLVDGVARRAEAEVVLPVLALHVGELRRDRDVEVVGVGLGEIDLENGRILRVGAARDDLRTVAFDDDARRHRLDTFHGPREEVCQPLVRLAVEVVLRIGAEDDLRRPAFGTDRAAYGEVGRRDLPAREGHLADVLGLDVASRVYAHVDDVVGVDVKDILVLGPDIERDGVGRRRVGDETRGNAAAGDGGVLVHGAPVGRVLVVVGEVYRLHVESALCERRVVAPFRDDARLCDRRLQRILEAPGAAHGVRRNRAVAVVGRLVKRKVPEGAQRVEGVDAAAVGSRGISLGRVFRLL